MGSCGGGGIVTDNQGNFVVVFSKKFEDETKNGAELKASTSRIKLCKELQLNKVCIESDSKIVVGWLEKKLCSLCWY